MNPNHTGQGAPFDETLPAREPRIAPTQQQAEVGGDSKMVAWLENMVRVYSKLDAVPIEADREKFRNYVSAYSSALTAAKHFAASPRPESPEGELLLKKYRRAFEALTVIMSTDATASRPLDLETMRRVASSAAQDCIDMGDSSESALPAKGPGPGRSERQRVELIDGICSAISIVGTIIDEHFDEDPPENTMGSPEREALQTLRGHLEGCLIDGETGQYMSRDAAMPPPASQSNPREHKPSSEQ